MKKTTLFLLAIIICNFVSAQDIIITKDAEKISAKVSDIEESVIKYKKFDNLDGPTYTMNKSEISSIIFENGSVEVFKEPTSNVQKPTTQRQDGYMNGEVRFITRQIGEVSGYGFGSGTIVSSGYFFLDGVNDMSGAELARAIRENPQNIITEVEYREYLQRYAPDAYRKYKQGDALGITGAIFLAFGLSSIVISPLMWLPTVSNDPDVKLGAFLGMFCGGAGLSLASIPLLTVAYHKQRVSSCDVYNEKYAHKSGRTEATLNIGANRYGFGIALRF